MEKLELVLKRVAARDHYTIGKLYINGIPFCDTLEDTDRELLFRCETFGISTR